WLEVAAWGILGSALYGFFSVAVVGVKDRQSHHVRSLLSGIKTSSDNYADKELKRYSKKANP